LDAHRTERHREKRARHVAIATVYSRTSTFTTPNGVVHENEPRVRTFVVVKREGRWLIMQDQNTVRN
jgi:hypothetical protein